jgi:hypothetical protein
VPLPPPPPPKPQKTRFFSALDLDPNTIVKNVSDLSGEVLKLLLEQAGADVTVSVEIHAKCAAGFDEDTQRALLENFSALKFKPPQFEA